MERRKGERELARAACRKARAGGGGYYCREVHSEEKQEYFEIGMIEEKRINGHKGHCTYKTTYVYKWNS